MKYCVVKYLVCPKYKRLGRNLKRQDVDLLIECIICCPGTEFNDAFVLDTSKVEWTELTMMIGGSAPLGRRYHGFTVCNGLLYVFGGYNINLG